MLRTAGTWLSALAALVVIAGSAPLPALAGDGTDLRGGRRGVTSDLAISRGLRLERGLSDIRTRLRDQPRRSLFELDRARRRLRELEVEAPRDPRLLRLERDIDRLEAEAYRVERRRDFERSLERLEATSPRLPAPSFARPPLTPDIRGRELPIGTAKRYLFVRNSLGDARAAFEAGERERAARHLDTAEAGLAALEADRADLAGDPNIVATKREIAHLRERLANEG